MNFNSENSKIKEWSIVVLKSIIFAVIGGALVAFVHMICGRYVLHIHGKPEFLSNSLIVFSAFDKFLVAVTYYILGRKIPIKNSILRGLAFVAFNWISNFLPQFMGLAFADGPVAEVAFRFSDLVCDSIVYVILGVVLGVLYKNDSYTEKRECNKKVFAKTVATSAVLFPVLVIIFDQTMRFIKPEFSSLYAIGVSESLMTQFYINFYSWFILSGAAIAVFYRMSEFNDSKSGMKFGLMYSLLLWTPVVMIMVVFGMELLATSVYACVFIMIIMFVCWMDSRLIEKE